MKDTSKNISLVARTLGILITAVLVLFNAASADAPKLTVGVILPLSGEYGPIGAKVREGIELFSKHSRPPFSIIIEDGGTMEPRRLLSAANKLLDIDKVSVLSVMIIDDAEPLAPITERREIPLVVLWEGNKRLLARRKTVFSVGYQNEATALVLAKAATKDSHKRIAIVGELSPWTEVVSAAFRAEVEKRGASLVATEMLSSGVADFSSTITKIKSKSPDSVLLALNSPGSMATFLKQAKARGLSARFLTGEAFVGDGAKLAGEAAQGVFTVWASSPALSALQTHLPSEVRSSPIDIGPIGIGYDGIGAIAQALATEGKNPLERFQKFLGPSHAMEKQIALFRIDQGQMILESGEFTERKGDRGE
jgi:branched-chain amino acid transport system substrate-binding protein